MYTTAYTTQAIETYLTKEQILNFINPFFFKDFYGDTFKVVIFPDENNREQEQKDILANKNNLKKDFNDSLSSGLSSFSI